MAINILPRSKGWGEVLGESLGEGITALAQGKIAQMEKRSNAAALERLGLDPNLAYAPKEYGLKALGAKYQQEQQQRGFEQAEKMAGIKALEKRKAAEQQAEYESNTIKSLEQEALGLGANPQKIKPALEVGGASGIKQLKEIIKDLRKPPKKTSYWQKIGFASPDISPYALTPEEAAQQKYDQLLQDIQRSKTPEAQQAEQQKLYNIQKQQEAIQNIEPKNGLDAINQAAQLKLLEQQTGSFEDEKTRIYNDAMNDSTIPDEIKKQLTEAREQAQSSGWAAYLGAPFGNFVTGVAQSLGTGLGIGPLIGAAKDVLPDIEFGGATAEQKEKYRERLGNILATEDPRSVDYQDALLALQNIDKRARLPNAQDIKDQVIRPMAQKLGLEKFINTRTYADEVGRRVGNATPGLLISGALQGIGAGAELLKSLGTSIGAEAAGELTKRISGSALGDFIVTMAGYLLFPQAGSGIIGATQKKAENAFEKGMKTLPKTRVADAQPLEEILEKTERIVTADPKSEQAQFLADRLHAVKPKISNISQSAAEHYGTSRNVIDPRALYDVDKAFSDPKTIEAAYNAGVVEEFKELQKAIRSVIDPYFAKKIPQATADMLSARGIRDSMAAKSLIEKGFDWFGDLRLPIFRKEVYLFKNLAKIGSKTTKWSKTFAQNPVLLRELANASIGSANRNVGQMTIAGIKLADELRRLGYNSFLTKPI